MFVIERVFDATMSQSELFVRLKSTSRAEESTVVHINIAIVFMSHTGICIRVTLCTVPQNFRVAPLKPCLHILCNSVQF
jgi:hypothetical protein